MNHKILNCKHITPNGKIQPFIGIKKPFLKASVYTNVVNVIRIN